MCTSPILIRNKKFRSIGVTTNRTFIKVPCGTCEECVRKRVKDLYIRARFESESIFMNGGNGFMCTLTYDNDNVPTLYYLGEKHMVFCKRDVILFIKRLRVKLDRFFQKNYGTSAPNFKYLVTSEYGSNPMCSHRPHYHMIVLFERSVSLYVFRKCFAESLINKKTGKSYFGKIYQCDLLDIKRGGVRYVGKYVLKDQSYSNQNEIITNYIKFYTDYVSNKYGINQFPQNEIESFANKCIRSSKAYKDDVTSYVGKYRDMLQFYLCSNDFGCSAIINRYGESLYSLGLLNIDSLPYSIPKAVINYVERTAGSEKRDELGKSIFVSQFKKACEDCVYRNLITRDYSDLLLDFVEAFVQPRYGLLYFVSPTSYNFYNSLCDYKLQPYDEVLSRFQFFVDNDFYEYRDAVLDVIGMCNTPLDLEIRAKSARLKSCKERERYEKKCFNNSYNYDLL